LENLHHKELLKISSVDVELSFDNVAAANRKRSISPSWASSRMDIGPLALKKDAEEGDLCFCGE